MATMIKTLSSLFCFVSLLSLLFSTNQSRSEHTYMTTICNRSSENFTETSQYQTNHVMLLSLLHTRSSFETYSNATAGVNPDAIHGMFLCRGDISQKSCRNCVGTATVEIAKNCTHHKEAFIFYEECMVRYSDIPFLTLLDETPYVARNALRPAPDLATFRNTLSGKLDELIFQVSSSLSSFVENEERVTLVKGSYDLDSMVQCSPDLDPRNCTVCLKHAVEKILDCCKEFRWAQYYLSKCLVRFEATALSSRPSSAVSFSINVMKGTEMFLKISIAVVTVYVSAFLGL